MGSSLAGTVRFGSRRGAEGDGLPVVTGWIFAIRVRGRNAHLRPAAHADTQMDWTDLPRGDSLFGPPVL
jgi:hypothetical protein